MQSPIGGNVIHPGPKWILFLVSFAPAWISGSGQTRVFDATNLRGPANLGEGWMVHAGDDPAYARPDFDDSSWEPFDTQSQSLHSLFPTGNPGVIWYRLNLRVPPTGQGWALLESGISVGALELYANGIKLAKVGEVEPLVGYETGAPILVPIPDNQSKTRSIVIALRMRIPETLWFQPRPGLLSTNIIFGETNSLREHMWYSILRGNSMLWLDVLASSCMLLGAALLYSTQQDRNEYLWLFLWILSGMPSAIFAVLSGFRAYPMSWHMVDVLSALTWAFLVARMYCAFVGHRIGWKLNLYAVLCGILGAFANWAVFFRGIPPAEKGLAWIPFGLLLLVILPVIMIRSLGPKNRAEGLLILPLLLAGITNFGFNACLAATSIPAIRSSAWKMTSILSGTTVGPFMIDYGGVADLLALLSLALIILVRSNRISRQQGMLQSEMSNARRVQEVLLSQAVENVPGFQIESVYLPACEVGGDFFQILPTKDQGLLVVVGDVAGKGMPAAMLVSVLVGAIRTAIEYDHSPAGVLAQLNERMLGRAKGGFATALAALIAADGSVHIANAGHLSPYLNACEIELPAALPLGIVGNARYETIRFTLEAEVRLTFYSDAVVEARNQKGEMFGFDRARILSTLRAGEIADGAKAFGQEDDITVVSIQRVPASRPATR